MGIFDIWTQTLGIDAGSQNLRIVKGEEIIFNEPSQISFDTVANEFNGMGKSVSTAKSSVTLMPVNYVLWDFHGFEMMLRQAIKKGTNSRSFLQKSVIAYFCIPTHASEVDKRAYRDSGEHANAKEVYLIYQGHTSAVGMNLLLEKKHFVLIDFSYSKIETSIFLDSKLISTNLVRYGTNHLRASIKSVIRKSYKMDITDDEAQEILESNIWTSSENELRVGYKTFDIKPVYEILNATLVIIKNQMFQAFENMEKTKDFNKVISNGVFATGGGSFNQAFVSMINPWPEARLTFSTSPLLDNINGLKKVIGNKALFKDYLMT